jgi:hypothetical protein
MTEEVKEQGSGNAQYTPESSGDQSEAQPQYVTVEQAEQMVREAVKQSQATAQKLVAKSGNRLKANVQEKLQALEATLKLQSDAGVEITPEQRKALQQQVVVDALAEEPEVDPNAQPSQSGETQPPAGQGEQPDPITQAAWSMMQERGVDILEDDPEFGILDMASPYKFLLSVDKAITTKETRLQKSSSEEPKEGSPHARIPGAGAGGQSEGALLPQGTPPIERLNTFYKKKGL